jgi:hypothetical protein
MTEEEEKVIKEVIAELERDKSMLNYFYGRFTAFYLKFNKQAQTRYCAGNAAGELKDMEKKYESWQRKLESLIKN